MKSLWPQYDLTRFCTNLCTRTYYFHDIFQADSGGDGGDPSSDEDGGGGEGGVSPYCATTVLVRYFHLTTFLWMFVEGEQSTEQGL